MRSVLAAAVALAALAVPASAPAAEPCTGAPSKACLLPFPNDAALTKRDRSTPTGRRLSLRRTAMPANAKGVRIDPTDYNRADGFSPGQPIVVRVPALSTGRALRRSRIAPVNDIGAFARKRAGVLLLDAVTGRRQPIWVELDKNAKARRELLINPARNLRNGRRYVVVLRNLRTARGSAVRPARGFHLPKRLRPTLRKARVKRDRSLYLAWDFTVASTASIAGRALSIRDDAFALLGDDDLADGRIAGTPPAHAITTVTDYTPEQNPLIARKVEGTVTVPCYLDTPGCAPGGRFTFVSDKPGALPQRTAGSVVQAPFACNVPRAATPLTPSRVALYGHGLLGGIGELDQAALQQLSNGHDTTFCATRWAGFAKEDVPSAITALGDLSSFPTIPDGSQQGFLNALYLGRLLAHPQGLATDPALQSGGLPLLKPGALAYHGNSQGGIFGGALTALAPDFTRATLGVPGMRFSTLLPRSKDFDTYRIVFDPAYPDRSTQPLVLSLIQLLWDRGEANGYAGQMTSAPLPGTPRHAVLLHPAVGDHQVSTVMADVEARTIGARRTKAELAPGRSTDKHPLWGIPTVKGFPFTGSAIVYWDSGGPLAPTSNTPPRQGEDPHEDPRATPAAQDQIAAFLETGGTLTDTCAGRPCFSAKHP